MRYILILIALAILTFSMLGCESLNTDDLGPRIRVIFINSDCGGAEPTPTGFIFSGVPGGITIEFDTENLNQAFEVQATLISDTVPLNKQPIVAQTATFKNRQTTPGRANGRKWATYEILPQCGGVGNYLFNAVIMDAHGRFDVFEIELTQAITPLKGDSPCVCKTQCGNCTFNYDTAIRCICGCPLPGEKCT